MTEKELEDIALWDAIGRRATAIVEHIRAQQGVTGVIDSKALEPKDGNEQD